MTVKPAIQSAIDAFRLRILAMEARSTSLLTAAYQDVLAQLEPQIAELAARIVAAQAAGEAPSYADLFRQERYQELLDQIKTAIDRYGQQTKQVTTASQQAVVRASLIEAGQLLAPVSGGSGGALAQLIEGWVQLPDDAIIRMVGALQKDSPLDTVLRSYGDDAVDQVAQVLLRGLALGQGADPLTREVANALGTSKALELTDDIERALAITRARAEVIVRTETLRAQRAASAAAYEQSGVAEGLRWVASLSDRTCGFCLSRHGKVFPLGTVMDSHPGCRCCWAPALGEPWDGGWESGEEWLKKQKLESQELVLGRQGAADFNAGNVQLSDFELTYHDDTWGPQGRFGGIGHARGVATKDGRAPERWADAPPRRKPADRNLTLPKQDEYYGLNPDDFDDPDDFWAAVDDAKIAATNAKKSAKTQSSASGLETLQAEGRTYKPGAGPRVGDATREADAIDARVREQVAEAERLIEQVHSDGELPEIPVLSEPMPDKGRFVVEGYRSGRIEISTRYADQAQSAVHEIGHFLDYEILRDVERGRVRLPIMDAIKGSKTGKRLLGSKTGEAAYLADDREFWARAYEEYIGVRTGNRDILSAIDRSLSSHSDAYWPYDEFVPIARAIDQAFARLGWIQA